MHGAQSRMHKAGSEAQGMQCKEQGSGARWPSGTGGIRKDHEPGARNFFERCRGRYDAMRQAPAASLGSIPEKNLREHGLTCDGNLRQTTSLEDHDSSTKQEVAGWHAACNTENNTRMEDQTMNAAVAMNTETLSMHHDMWVEMATIEMTMETLGQAANDPHKQQLEQRYAQLRHAMQRLPA